MQNICWDESTLSTIGPSIIIQILKQVPLSVVAAMGEQNLVRTKPWEDLGENDLA